MHHRPDLDLDRLVRDEYPRLVRTARLIVRDGDAAEEIAQEAVARLVERWDRLRHYDDAGAWLRLVAVRLARRHREGPPPAPLVGLDQRARPGARSEAEVATSRVAVASAIQALPRAQREAVVLYYVYDLGAEAIAAELGRRPGTVRAQLHQARQRLAGVLAQEVTDVGR